jgi:hypothetical protein
MFGLKLQVLIIHSKKHTAPSWKYILCTSLNAKIIHEKESAKKNYGPAFYKESQNSFMACYLVHFKTPEVV